MSASSERAAAVAQPAAAGQEAGPAASGRERRRHPRVMAGMRVRFRCQDLAAFIKGYSLNLSAGGFFVRCAEPLPRGSRLQFEFLLENGKSLLRGTGEVAWSAGPAVPGQRPRVPGMGVRFVALDAASRRILDRILAERQAEAEGAPAAAEPTPVARAAHGGSPVGLAATAEPARRDWLVDSIITCMELAELARGPALDELRGELAFWCDEYFDGQVVDLSLAWAMLLAATRVSLEQAAVAMALFARALPVHGFAHRLPEGLEHFTGYRRALAAADDELAAAGGFSTALAQVAARYRPAAARARRAGPLRTGLRLLGLMLIGMSLGAGAWVLVAPRGPEPVDLSHLRHCLRLDAAQRQDERLWADIADRRWSLMSRRQRRQALREVAERLSFEGVRRIDLRDARHGRSARMELDAAGRWRIRLAE
jgi:uncharacterized protein (TIGR02266 family)